MLPAATNQLERINETANVTDHGWFAGMRASCRVLSVILTAVLASSLPIDAQPARTYRVGVVLQGGPYSGAVDGLRDGLKDLGLEDGKQIAFHVHDVQGDVRAVEAVARNLEGEKVDLIYAVATSVAAVVKRATKRVPIVFYAGTDPVASGLVQSFRNPGERLTGVHSQFADLGAKRLELLKALVPTVRRVLTFYSPDNPIVEHNMKVARDAAHRLDVELVERRVASTEGLRAALRGLRPGEADALLVIDAMMGSQAALIIEAARAKRLPSMFQDQETVAKGALASYGVSYYEAGRLAAKQVQRVLMGASPGDLPVEQIDRLRFVINRKTAEAIGVTIPPSVLARADEIIE
jgi:putative ABC transport system substrate-binding protein